MNSHLKAPSIEAVVVGTPSPGDSRQTSEKGRDDISETPGRAERQRPPLSFCGCAESKPNQGGGKWD
jgi:hypothetical protein